MAHISSSRSTKQTVQKNHHLKNNNQQSINGKDLDQYRDALGSIGRLEKSCDNPSKLRTILKNGSSYVMPFVVSLRSMNVAIRFVSLNITKSECHNGEGHWLLSSGAEYVHGFIMDCVELSVGLVSLCVGGYSKRCVESLYNRKLEALKKEVCPELDFWEEQITTKLKLPRQPYEEYHKKLLNSILDLRTFLKKQEGYQINFDEFNQYYGQLKEKMEFLFGKRPIEVQVMDDEERF